jgi:hypothetical protein
MPHPIKGEDLQPKMSTSHERRMFSVSGGLTVPVGARDESPPHKGSVLHALQGQATSLILRVEHHNRDVGQSAAHDKSSILPRTVFPFLCSDTESGSKLAEEGCSPS